MSGIQTIDPRDMAVDDWTAQMTLALDQFGPIPVLFAVDDWRKWGLSVISLESLSGINMPDPTFFDDWRRWAAEFNGVLESR